MPIDSRGKGMRGQREAAILIQEAFPWMDPHSGAQYRKGSDAPDIEGTPWWIEVKRRKVRCNIPHAMDQAVRETDGRTPVVLSRQDRGRWLVTMTWEDWSKLVPRQVDVVCRQCQARAPLDPICCPDAKDGPYR